MDKKQKFLMEINPKVFGVDTSCRIFAFDGSKFPSGSIKDVTVKYMLDCYKQEGNLKANSTIIEATSGNTGISLAYYQKEFDYKCIIVLPKSASENRKIMIKEYGATLIEVDGGMKECEEKALELIKSTPNSFIFSQFSNDNNYKAHINMTAPIINDSLDKIDYIFAGIGTGGTISGIGAYFKNNNLSTKIIGIEPFESPLITKGFANSHLIQGIGANFIPITYHKEYIDEVILTKGNESIEMAKAINDTNDFFVGYSSGAALLGAFNYIKEHKLDNKNIVIVFPDKGDRYSW